MIILFKKVLIENEKIRKNIFQWVHWITIRVIDRPLTCYTRQIIKKYDDIYDITPITSDPDMDSLVRIETKQLIGLTRYKILRGEEFPITSQTLKWICRVIDDQPTFMTFFKRYRNLFTEYNVNELILEAKNHQNKVAFMILLDEFKGRTLVNINEYYIKEIHFSKIEVEENILQSVNTLEEFIDAIVAYKVILTPRDGNLDSQSKDLLNLTFNRLCSSSSSSSNNSVKSNLKSIFTEINQLYDDLINSSSHSSSSNNLSFIWIKLIALRLESDYYQSKRQKIVESIIKHNSSNKLVEYLLNLEQEELCLEDWIFDTLCKFGTYEQIVYASGIIGDGHEKKRASYKAMDWAAQKGRIDVVQYLCNNRSEECSQLAVQCNPHRRVVMYLLHQKPELSKYITKQSLLEMADLDFLLEFQNFIMDSNDKKNDLVISRIVVGNILSKLSQQGAIRMIDYLHLNYPLLFSIYHFFSEACMMGLEEVVYHLHNMASSSHIISPLYDTIKTTIFDDAFLYGMNQTIVDFLIENRREGFGIESWIVVGQSGTPEQYEMLNRYDHFKEYYEALIQNCIRYGNITLFNYIQQRSNSSFMDTIKFKLFDVSYAARLHMNEMVLLAINNNNLQDLNILLFKFLEFDRVDLAVKIYQKIKDKHNNNINNNNNSSSILTENQINYLIKRFDYQVIDFLINYKHLTQSFIDDHRFKLCHPKLPIYHVKYLSQRLSTKSISSKWDKSYINLAAPPLYQPVNNNSSNYNSISTPTTNQIIIQKVLKNRYLLRKIFRSIPQVPSVYKQNDLISLSKYRPKLLWLLLQSNSINEIRIDENQLSEFCSNCIDLELFKLFYSRFQSRFTDPTLLTKVLLKNKNIGIFKTLADQTDPVVLELDTTHQLNLKCSDAALYLYNLGRLAPSMIGDGPFSRKYFGHSRINQTYQFFELDQLKEDQLSGKEKKLLYHENIPLEIWKYHHRKTIHYNSQKELTPKIIQFRLYNISRSKRNQSSTNELWDLSFRYFDKNTLAALYHLVKGYQFYPTPYFSSSILNYLVNEHAYMPSETLSYFSGQPPSALLSKYYLSGIVSSPRNCAVTKKKDLLALLYMEHDVFEIFNNLELSGSRLTNNYSTLVCTLIDNIIDKEKRARLVSRINPTMYMPLELLKAIVDCYMEQDSQSLPSLKHFLAPKYNEKKMEEIGFDMIGLISHTFTSAQKHNRTSSKHRFTRVFGDHLLVYTIINCSLSYVQKIWFSVPNCQKEIDRLVLDAMSPPSSHQVRQMEMSKISSIQVYQFFFERCPSREEYLFSQPYINNVEQYKVVKQILLEKDPNDMKFIVYALKYAYNSANAPLASQVIADSIHLFNDVGRSVREYGHFNHMDMTLKPAQLQTITKKHPDIMEFYQLNFNLPTNNN